NDYLIDRQAQRSMHSFTGIPGIRQQDMAVTESMGPIYDRESEHLGTTDALIIRTRRRMIAATRALEEQGRVPPGADTPELDRQQSGLRRSFHPVRHSERACSGSCHAQVACHPERA